MPELGHGQGPTEMGAAGNQHLSGENMYKVTDRIYCVRMLEAAAQCASLQVIFLLFTLDCLSPLHSCLRLLNQRPDSAFREHHPASIHSLPFSNVASAASKYTQGRSAYCGH